MLTQQDLEEFEKLRQAVLIAIRLCYEAGDSGKSYEGSFAICFPSYHEPNDWTIVLDCYLLGPSRHYQWSGKSFKEALAKATEAIKSWGVDV